jgi:hypothetical protein
MGHAASIVSLARCQHGTEHSFQKWVGALLGGLSSVEVSHSVICAVMAKLSLTAEHCKPKVHTPCLRHGLDLLLVTSLQARLKKSMIRRAQPP